MKKIFLLIFVIILFSCKKEDSLQISNPIKLTDSRQQQIESLKLTAEIAYSKQDYSSSLESYFKIIDLIKDSNDNEEKASLLGKIGQIYYLNSFYDISLIYFLKGLKILETTNNKFKTSEYCHNIGFIYYAQHDYQNSLKFFTKALENSVSLDSDILLLDAYTDLGNSYQALKNYTKALEYHQKTLQISLTINNKKYQAISYNNIAADYQQQDKYTDTVISFYTKALEIQKTLNDPLQAFTGYNIGLIRKKINQYPESIKSFEEAIESGKKYGDLQTIADAQEQLAEINKLLGFSSKSSQYFEDQNNTLKKLNQEKLALATIEQQNKIELSRITLERDYQDKQNVSGSRMNTLLYISIGITTLFFGLIGLYVYERKRKNQGTSAAINLLDYLLKDNEHWKKTRGNS